MRRTAWLIGGGALAGVAAAATAAGQLWLADATTLVEWGACFCETGGDDTFLFITTFVTWMEAMSVLAGAVAGAVFLTRMGQPGHRAMTAAVVTAAAAGGALVGVPIATAGAAAVTGWYTPVEVIREAALLGIAVGVPFALAAVWSRTVSVAGMLSWVWLWAIGLAASRLDNDHTESLGMIWSQLQDPLLDRTIRSGIPLLGMLLIASGTAWWSSRAGTPGALAASGALTGAALVAAAYLSVGPGTESQPVPFGIAFQMSILSIFAAAGGAVISVLRRGADHVWPEWVALGASVVTMTAGAVLIGEVESPAALVVVPLIALAVVALYSAASRPRPATQSPDRPRRPTDAFT